MILAICEGACNGLDRVATDTLVRDWAMDAIRTLPVGVDRMPGLPAPLVRAQRALVHTPHHRLTSDTLTCATCETARRW